MVLGIDHIELIVRDVDEFVEFYEKLGFEVLLRTAHHGGSAELKLPGDNQPVLEIHSATGEESIGINQSHSRWLTPKKPTTTWCPKG